VNNLQRLLIKHEGMRLKPYEDVLTEDITIGVGRNLDSLGLTEDEVMYLLTNDIVRCDKELLHNFKWYPELCRARQDALINLCFNLGITRLLTFKKALQAMADKDYVRAADEFLDSKWATQVGSNRTDDIACMIRTGKYPTV
jgi:lysozyme